MASNWSVLPAPAEPDIAAMARKELAQALVRFITRFSVALVRKPAGQSEPRIGVADRQSGRLRNQQEQPTPDVGRMNMPPGHEIVADTRENKHIGHDKERHGAGLHD